jgi:hypothetical protein
VPIGSADRPSACCVARYRIDRLPMFNIIWSPLSTKKRARLAEMARFDHGWGRDFAAQVGGEAEAIEQEVMRRIRHTIHPKLIKLAFQDAIEQRKPRW